MVICHGLSPIAPTGQPSHRCLRIIAHKSIPHQTFRPHPVPLTPIVELSDDSSDSPEEDPEEEVNEDPKDSSSANEDDASI